MNMLNIHTGRENLDKDRFMFDRIKERLSRGKRVILIVPDQFTLQAEKNAFAYLDTKGLMDLDVLSFSRLANRVFSEVGGNQKTFINNYGKYMMISRILLNENPDLKIFRDLEGSADFVEKINNFISEIKNHEITPDKLENIIKNEDGDSILSRKLEDISRIYDEYEKKMGSDQIDTADYLAMFISKISQASIIKEYEFWMTGFDYLTPRNMKAVLEIAKTAASIDVVLTAEAGNSFFKSTNVLAEELRVMSLEVGVQSKINMIDKKYKRDRSNREMLSHLEANYCSPTPKAYPQTPNAIDDTPNAIVDTPSSKANLTSPPNHSQTSKNNEPEDEYKHDNKHSHENEYIQLISAANYYAEAETAAAKITQLIRDEGMRYRDILVICNDMEVRASVIKRVFSEYGIPVFTDQRRGVHHNPVLEYITALLDIMAEGLRMDLVFKLLKTGLTSLIIDEIEELENYAIKFKITGNKWKSEFKLTAGEYSDEDLVLLNEARRELVDLISGFQKGFKKSKTGRERTEYLFQFLSEEAKLPEKINEYIITLEKDGSLEYGEEMSQVWKVVIGIMDQLVAILGEEELTEEEFSVILKTGFESVQIGMLPPSVDQILLGTMQRTRTGRIKALFVLGANDGVLPTYSGEETLLNEDERDILYNKGNIICRSDDQIMREEQMAIYRNLSKPSAYLFMSYSVSDTEGGEIRPSIIFEKIHRLFPTSTVKKDILNREEEPLNLVQAQFSTVNHLTDAMRNFINDDLMPKVWQNVYKWFEEHENEVAKRIVSGLSFRNNRDKIDTRLITQLYKPSVDSQGEKIISSPSGLENFSRCPFSFFMSRGIRLKERRIYELDSRDIGDVYHETLMHFGKSLSEDGLPPMDENSKWNTITNEECQTIVSKIYDQIEDTYNQGLFKESNYEKYRSSRFKKIITDVAIKIKDQVQAGQVDRMYFESVFSQSGEFDPIIVENEGRSVEVTGKMDRLDVLKGGYAKIIDYKSGSEKLAVDDIMSGWQLQLMIYMKAVTESKKPLKPAGVFYFKIPEPHLKTSKMTADEIKEELQKKMADDYVMDGMVINDKSVVEAITGELTKTGSKIISAKADKDDPQSATGKAVVDKEDFVAIENTVSSLITKLCTDMLDGDIKADPKESKSKKITACTYCSYRGVCGYDKSFDS